MTKFNLILFSLLFSTPFSFAQSCNCERNFEWKKKTFEENDAGFEYAIKAKGTPAYDEHNRKISER